MKSERIILSFVGILIGLIFAGMGFYLYQSSKTVPITKPQISNENKPSQSPALPGLFLVLDQPTDEEVATSRTVTVSGKTSTDTTIVILTDSDQQIIKPSAQGNFSTTVTIAEGENVLRIIGISPAGESSEIQRTVSYTSESF